MLFICHHAVLHTLCRKRFVFLSSAELLMSFPTKTNPLARNFKKKIPLQRKITSTVNLILSATWHPPLPLLFSVVHKSVTINFPLLIPNDPSDVRFSGNEKRSPLLVSTRKDFSCWLAPPLLSASNCIIMRCTSWLRRREEGGGGTKATIWGSTFFGIACGEVKPKPTSQTLEGMSCLAAAAKWCK